MNDQLDPPKIMPTGHLAELSTKAEAYRKKIHFAGEAGRLTTNSKATDFINYFEQPDNLIDQLALALAIIDSFEYQKINFKNIADGVIADIAALEAKTAEVAAERDWYMLHTGEQQGVINDLRVELDRLRAK